MTECEFLVRGPTMTGSEPTERAVIETLADELAWAVDCGIRWTAFARDGLRLTAWWSDDGVAYHATLTDSTTRGTLLFDGDAGEWVLDRLRDCGTCPGSREVLS